MGRIEPPQRESSLEGRGFESRPSRHLMGLHQDLGLSTMKIGDVCDKERAFGDGTVDDKSDLPQLLERRNASAARP